MMARYPKPKVPIRPILSFASFTGPREADVPSVEDAGRTVWVTSGRIAIAMGLRSAGIGTGDEILLPAYNCSTTVAAVEAVGVKPVFYRSFTDLSPDMTDVEGKITGRTRALLVVHYFGFPQAIEIVQQFCRQRDLVLVEDCAHAYFGQYRDRPLGAYGDFAVTSAVKFFPISDGGCLVFPAKKYRNIPLHSGGRGFEIKSVVNDIERSVHYKRFKPVTWLLKLPLLLKDLVWSSVKQRRRTSSEVSFDDNERADNAGDDSFAPGSSYGGYGFDTAWMNVSISHFSRFLIRRLPRGRMVRRRRENFHRFLDALSGYANARPMFSKLPEDVVPYVFPLVVSSVDEVFPVLKTAGVPIMRWEDIDHSVCEVSTRYSMQLLQFPCHQEVSTRELNWMIEQIQSALSASD